MATIEYLANLRRRYRWECIHLLGGRCVRCGITYPLTFDHVFDDGYIERKAKKGGNATMAMYRAILAGERERYQLLCHNCNHLKTHDPEEFASPPTYGVIP